MSKPLVGLSKAIFEALSPTEVDELVRLLSYYNSHKYHGTPGVDTRVACLLRGCPRNENLLTLSERTMYKEADDRYYVSPASSARCPKCGGAL